MLVSRQFIEPLAGKRLAAVLSWVSLPVQLAILMLSRSYAVCLGRDAIAVIRPPHRRSWTVAGLLEVLGWFVLIDVVVTWLSVFVPVAGRGLVGRRVGREHLVAAVAVRGPCPGEAGAPVRS